MKNIKRKMDPLKIKKKLKKKKSQKILITWPNKFNKKMRNKELMKLRFKKKDKVLSKKLKP